ncbi:class I SAM-dependent methyltransferase [Oscillatoria salina]|uniref:class I SAM-dependent methyltransferase n=1 Tax=Oscillatoria salina TaxID=331517 RepID=UPI001CCD948E|nr:SAM-dependent methyltransferase [Oscillatoria salina]MBZ8180845.1 SAM-dependent methyltransferase [Oscillatoria salina IIICB1]
MSIAWENSTNKGTSMLKLIHQFQSELLFKDNYLNWFFAPSLIDSLQKKPPNIDELEVFQRIAYWYILVREKYGDEVIEASIKAGCKQLLLLGSGYDTRFFRLASIQNNSVKTFEIDLPETINDKKKCLIAKLKIIPHGLSLISLDLNKDNLNSLVDYGFESEIPTIYIWQGVSYYLTQESIDKVLDYIKKQMTPNSVFVFDCCSPLMTFKNDRVPGINSNIERLAEIGEPYRFGMYSDEMELWLREKGFQNIQILQQNDLEERFLERRTLPDNMWYVVTIKA